MKSLNILMFLLTSPKGHKLFFNDLSNLVKYWLESKTFNQENVSSYLIPHNPAPGSVPRSYSVSIRHRSPGMIYFEIDLGLGRVGTPNDFFPDEQLVICENSQKWLKLTPEHTLPYRGTLSHHTATQLAKDVANITLKKLLDKHFC